MGTCVCIPTFYLIYSFSNYFNICIFTMLHKEYIYNTI